MITIIDKRDCCGCSACASICAHNAITMTPDALGFLYPVVDVNKCSDCGLCEKVCSFNENYDKSLNFEKPFAYGARHKDPKEVASSRSGAAFIAISDQILELDGVVYGVGYKDHFRVTHKRATNKEQRDEFKGSKYVQSDIGDCFRQIKEDLKKNRIVLFSGTPCQTSGLNSYVGKKLRKNLYLIDIVCHGVPSPYIWRDYIDYLEKKQHDTISWVNFRDKEELGWSSFKETFCFINTGKRAFNHLFYQQLYFRHSCSSCKFCNTQRPSDITIADFWGWEKTNPEFNKDDKGVNLVLVNTEKGFQLFEKISGVMDIFPAKLENCLQTHLRRPCTMHPNRNDFEYDYAKNGFLHSMKKYGDFGFKAQFLKRYYNFRSHVKQYINFILKK